MSVAPINCLRGFSRGGAETLSIFASKTLRTLRPLREPNLFRAEGAGFAENAVINLSVSASSREILAAPFGEGCAL
jgi:hypothetical protein